MSAATCAELALIDAQTAFLIGDDLRGVAILAGALHKIQKHGNVVPPVNKRVRQNGRSRSKHRS